MKNCIVALISSLLLTSSSFAGVMSLTLDSGGTDLNNLTVGDVVTIDVVLDRMAVGRLTDLGATVEISTPDDFSDPATNVLAGGIIPDPDDFFALPGFNPGSVDGQFSSFFSLGPNPEIATSGVFYSFDLTAATPGTGVIRFDTFSLFAIDDAFNLYDGTDFHVNELTYNVSSSGVVPEPTSLTCFLAITGMGLARRSRRVLA